ncbi:hypothetical protein AB5J52_46185 [Streptomyces sp. R39]|uniref:Uncharacterized protein n=1 Tax=Streptomyces sp. R39 TaxID=3238631 RepID=A0AB39R2J1_9ACTN
MSVDVCEAVESRRAVGAFSEPPVPRRAERGVLPAARGLPARYERTGGRLRVCPPARPDVLADDLACRRDDVRAHLGRLPRDPLHDGRVVLVGRATATDSVLAGGTASGSPSY